MKNYDIIIIGAGAAGLFAASTLSKTNTVCVIDMGDEPARKVAVSGGGKCNFTNTTADYTHYFGENPNFVRSALTQFTPNDTLNWVKSHNIEFSEKTPGQYFATSAADIVTALMQDAKNAKLMLNTTVKAITKDADIFYVTTTSGTLTAKKLVVATGGISFAQLGTSDFGYKIAKQFGHKIIPPRPALCAMATKIFKSDLSGISLPVMIKINRETINDTMLFTHFGIGGPAIYRTSVRDCNNGFTINLLPDTDVFDWLKSEKQKNGKKQLKTILGTKLPERVAAFFAENNTKNIADYKDTELQEITNRLTKTTITPGSFTMHNFQSAECTRGGVDTSKISSKTMESKLCPNLYFIGEVLDIAGDLGGYNLQWAWSSAMAIK